ncbi:MAG: hypothetical protein K2Q11_05560 [Burkholderiaceae bacterium]|nr:hypothetical protein [Burkholderiaceae bacterium]
MYDPQQIKNTAFSFFVGADRCFEQRPLPIGQFEMPLAPAIVCTAFGIELCLKAIIAIENGKATGHDLLKLFIKLSKESKTALASALSLDEIELLNEIGSISRAFVEWRYIYESQSANIDVNFLRRLASEVSRLLESMANLPFNTDGATSRAVG